MLWLPVRVHGRFRYPKNGNGLGRAVASSMDRMTISKCSRRRLAKSSAMKWITFVSLWITASTTWMTAQVSVKIEVPHQQYLADEALQIAVKITNFSGQTLFLGESDEWLRISVQSAERFIVPRTGLIPVAGKFTVETAMVATKRVNLQPYFELSRSGRYMVTATVQIPQWDQEIQSPPTWFNITNGVTVWEQTFGVQGTADPDQRPEVRRFMLLQSTVASKMMLYFRLANSSGNIAYRVYPLGYMVSFGRPSAQIDQHNRLHVLNQYGAKAFNYCVIDQDGELLTRETYLYTGSRPALKTTESGEIIVAGGLLKQKPPAVSVPNTGATPESPTQSTEAP